MKKKQSAEQKEQELFIYLKTLNQQQYSGVRKHVFRAFAKANPKPQRFSDQPQLKIVRGSGK